METNLSVYVADFIATKRTEGRSLKALDWHQWLLDESCVAVNDPPLADFTLTMVRSFVAALQRRETRYENHPISPEKAGGLSSHTVSAYVRTLKVFSAWLLDEGFTKVDVLAKLKRPKRPELVHYRSGGELSHALSGPIPTGVPRRPTTRDRPAGLKQTMLTKKKRCDRLAAPLWQFRISVRRRASGGFRRTARD